MNVAESGVIVSLSVVWLLAGASKLASPGTTAAFLTQSVSPRVTAGTVRFLAIVEIAISLALVAPATRRASAVLSLAAAGVLAAILVRAAATSRRQLPCGCFGPLIPDRRIGAGQYALVASMLLLSALILIFQDAQPYLGLHSQTAAVVLATVLIGARHLKLRHIAIYGPRPWLED